MRAVARPAIPERATLRSLWRYARYAVVERATVQTWNRVNLVLLGWLATSAVTGRFTVARDLSSPALFVVGATAAGVMAQVSDRHRSDERVAGVIRDALAHSSVLAVPMLAAVAAAPERVVLALYGPAYAGAAPFLVGLAVYQLLVSQSRPVAAALKGLDRPDVVVRLSVVCFALDVLLGVAAFFATGPVGVVVATVAAQSAWLALGALVLRTHVDALAVPRELGLQAVGGVVTYATVALVAPLLPRTSVLSLAVVASLGGAVYVGVLLLSPATRSVVADLAPI
ncbi:lipopolysaccharide biosynthesis protein [Halosimplex aquaticum]